MGDGQRAGVSGARAAVVATVAVGLMLFAPLGAVGGAALVQTAATVRSGPLGIDDYFQDWAAGRNALEGRSIYEPLGELARRHAGSLGQSFESTQRYDALPVNAHPPFAVLLLLPLSAMDYADAWLPFAWLNLLGILLAVPLCLWALQVPAEGPRAAMQLLWHLACVATSFPFVFQVAVGNLEGILLLCLAVAFALELRGRRAFAGGVLGLAALIKIAPLIFLLPMLLGRRWKQATALVGTCAAGSVATLVAFGWKDHVRFVEVAASGASRWSGGPTNVSLPSTVRRWLVGYDRPGWPAVEAVLPAPAPWADALGLLLSVALVVSVMVTVWRRPQERARTFSLVLLLSVLASPMAWPHSLLLAYPALAWLWTRGAGLGRGCAVALAAASALLWCDERALWGTLTGAEIWPERFSALANAGLLSLDTVALLVVLWIASAQSMRRKNTSYSASQVLAMDRMPPNCSPKSPASS